MAQTFTVLPPRRAQISAYLTPSPCDNDRLNPATHAAQTQAPASPAVPAAPLPAAKPHQSSSDTASSRSSARAPHESSPPTRRPHPPPRSPPPAPPTCCPPPHTSSGGKPPSQPFGRPSWPHSSCAAHHRGCRLRRHGRGWCHGRRARPRRHTAQPPEPEAARKREEAVGLQHLEATIARAQIATRRKFKRADTTCFVRVTVSVPQMTFHGLFRRSNAETPQQ